MDLKQIGTQHPKIRQVLAIQKNSAPNPRKLLVAEGLWAHNLLLSSDTMVDTFFWCPEAPHGSEAVKRAEQLVQRASCSYLISERTLARISERDKPDGMVSIAQLPIWDHNEIRFGRSALVMVADGMEIPGNLGTLIRTLDACAADCLVLTNRRTRLTHPKVFRASHGMVLTKPVVEFAQRSEVIAWLGANSFDIYLADAGESKNYRSYKYADRRTAFVLGSERYGVAKEWYESGCERVNIPMQGRADSLNVAVSAAVLMFEARAQKNGW